MRSLYLAAALCVAFQLAQATTYNSDGSNSDVQAKINLCADGDTVTLPAGTFTYSKMVSVGKSITLIGSGIDQTIIIDEVPRVVGSAIVIQFSSTSGTALSRLSGMTLQGGTINKSITNDGSLYISLVSTAPNFRMDHIKCNGLWGRNVTIRSSVWGVVDHCTFIRGAAHWNGCFDIYHNSWKGVGNMGDNSWADDTSLGTEKALYIEDCS